MLVLKGWTSLLSRRAAEGEPAHIKLLSICRSGAAAVYSYAVQAGGAASRSSININNIIRVHWSLYTIVEVGSHMVALGWVGLGRVG